MKIGLGRRGIGEARESRGRNARVAAKLLGEHLRSFEPGRRLRRTEGRDAGRLEVIDDTRDQGCLRPDDREIDRVLLAKRDRSRRDPSDRRRGSCRIPRCRDCPARRTGDRRGARGDLRGERVLAPAGADEQDVHEGLPRGIACSPLTTDRGGFNASSRPHSTGVITMAMLAEAASLTCKVKEAGTELEFHTLADMRAIGGAGEGNRFEVMRVLHDVDPGAFARG